MPIPDDQRRQRLVWAVQSILAKPGGTVQVAGPYDAVINGPGMSHTAHIILTILFMGFWIPIWLLIAATYKRSVYRVSVDEEGQIAVFDATRQRAMQIAHDGTLLYV